MRIDVTTLDYGQVENALSEEGFELVGFKRINERVVLECRPC